MILINLLPHRQAARWRRKRFFQWVLCLSALTGVLVAGAAYGWLTLRIRIQHGRNAYLQAEVAALNVQIGEVHRLYDEIQTLQHKQTAVEKLLSQRKLPVYLFNVLTQQLPEGIYLNAVRQSGAVVEVQGQAVSNDKVAELLNALSASASWLSEVQLKEVKAGTVELPDGVHKVVNFRLVFTLDLALTQATMPLLSVAWLSAVPVHRQYA